MTDPAVNDAGMAADLGMGAEVGLYEAQPVKMSRNHTSEASRVARKVRLALPGKGGTPSELVKAEMPGRN
jgi:hypothetical protein